MGIVLMDLFKAYDCIPYDLLIAKLTTYGFANSSLQVIYSYLSGRKRRAKIGSTCSDWLDIASGVPQGSIIGSQLQHLYK